MRQRLREYDTEKIIQIETEYETEKIRVRDREYETEKIIEIENMRQRK